MGGIELDLIKRNNLNVVICKINGVFFTFHESITALE